MIDHHQTIVGIVGTAAGLAMAFVAWRARSQHLSCEPDMERVARFTASARPLPATADLTDTEIRITVRIRKDTYRDARTAQLDLSAACEAGIRRALESRSSGAAGADQ